MGGCDGEHRLDSVECLDLDDINKGWSDAPPMREGKSYFGAYDSLKEYRRRKKILKNLAENSQIAKMSTGKNTDSTKYLQEKISTRKNIYKKK